MKLLYITNDVAVAKIADTCGIDIIFIDLEILGKAERQKGRDTVKSKHEISDIQKVKNHLSNAKVLVRINPIHSDSKNEIDRVVEQNPDIIMLPMIKTIDDVKTFLRLVGNRIQTCLLIETKESVDIIQRIIDIDKDSIYYIGLNDLHLSYKQHFMFEPLIDGTVESLSKLFNANDLTFGFGGIARIGEGMLSSQNIITEHYRLGSTMAILSRTFCDTQKIKDIDKIQHIMHSGVQEIRDFEKSLEKCSNENYEKNKHEVYELVSKIKNIIIQKKG